MTRRSLYKIISYKTGMKPHEIRVSLAKTGTTAAKQLLVEALGEEAAKSPGEAWFKVLHFVLPTLYEIAKKEGRVPDVATVVAQVKAKHPEWEAEVRKAFEESMSYVA